MDYDLHFDHDGETILPNHQYRLKWLCQSGAIHWAVLRVAYGNNTLKQSGVLKYTNEKERIDKIELLHALAERKYTVPSKVRIAKVKHYI